MVAAMIVASESFRALVSPCNPQLANDPLDDDNCGGFLWKIILSLFFASIACWKFSSIFSSPLLTVERLIMKSKNLFLLPQQLQLPFYSSSFHSVIV
jgi:hypothetical protein